MNYAPVGVPDLDNILSGGLPAGELALITGLPGSGKTLFSVAFACSGLGHEQATVYASSPKKHSDFLQRRAACLGIDLTGRVGD